MSSSDARVRFGHCCPDAPALGAIVDGEPTFRGVEFRTVTDYDPLAPGPHRLQLVREPDAGDPLLDVSFDLPEAEHVTALAIGTEHGLQPLMLADAPTEVPDGTAPVRFVHAAVDVPPLDGVVGDRTLFEDVTVGEWAGYEPLAPGTHTLELRSAGDEAFALPLPGLEFPDGVASTVVLVGRTGDDSLGAVVRSDAAEPVEATD